MAETTQQAATSSKPAPRPGVVSSITIRGFKSIVEAKVELGRLNVFVGPNGAGKTVVLEAVGVLGAAADVRVDDATLLRRGVRPGVPELYKNAFADIPVPRVIRLTANAHSGASYSVSLDNPIGEAATPWRFNAETLAVGKRKVVTRSPRGARLWDAKGRSHPFRPKDPTRSVADTPNPFSPLPDAALDLLSTLRSYAIYDPQTPVLRGIGQEAAPLDPLGIHGGRLAEAVRFLMRPQPGAESPFLADASKMIEWAEEVGAAEPTPDLISPSLPAAKLITRFRDRYMKEGRKDLSAYDASEGALYVLFAFAMLFHPKAPRLYAIENIDHALHPRLARLLVRTLGAEVKSTERQMLLTTHNPLVLDGLDLADDDIRLFTVDRDRRGHTIVRRVAYSEALEQAKKEGLTLSQMWTRGLIGAVPNII